MSAARPLLAAAAARLGGDAGWLEAELLLAHVLGRTRAWLYAHATDAVTAEVQAAFEELLVRRIAGEPVAYLLGEREFWDFTLAVSPATLIPRPETELLVELALARLPYQTTLNVADLGTGSGAIALALARERPCVLVSAIDASAEVVAIARRNAERLQLSNVRFVVSNWYATMDIARFTLIVSNPPYLAEDDVHLERGDLRFEPQSALVSGADGLDALRCIVAGAPNHLEPEGWLIVEHGYAQGEAVRSLFVGAGFTDVATMLDMEGRDRATLGQKAQIADER